MNEQRSTQPEAMPVFPGTLCECGHENRAHRGRDDRGVAHEECCHVQHRAEAPDGFCECKNFVPAPQQTAEEVFASIPTIKLVLEEVVPEEVYAKLLAAGFRPQFMWIRPDGRDGHNTAGALRSIDAELCDRLNALVQIIKADRRLRRGDVTS